MAVNVSASADGSMKQKSKRYLIVGTWNVRTLVESTGDERICRKRPVQLNKHRNHDDHGKVDRKLDLVVRELKRYRVSVAGIQESKWFGSDVWPADGYTFLHSGRPLPCDHERATRNEGVGIALDEMATVAWKNAGEVWKAVSSRIVMARLLWADAGKRKHGRSRRSNDTHVSVICAYAPTAKAPPGVKQKFYTDPLQSVDSMKYLGITITSDLNWSTHIKNQCSKAKKLVGLLYRRYYHYSNSDTLIKLYLTLVRPHLKYACQVWDPYLAKNRSALESVQKFALRMCMKQWDSSYNDLLDVLNLPTLEARRRNLRLSTLYNLKEKSDVLFKRLAQRATCCFKTG